MKSYSCVLFDFDGTLIDTIELIYQSYRHLVRNRLGRDIGREDVVPYIGTPLKRQFRNQFPSASEADLSLMLDEFMAFQYTIYRDYIRVFPGVPDVLSVLKSRGILTGVVTSRRRDSAELYIRELGLKEYFDILVAMEDTAVHKPDPAPVRKALDLMDVPAAEALFVGDAEFDILSGTAAGTDTAFVLWGPNDPSCLPVSPTYLLRHMNDLLP